MTGMSRTAVMLAMALITSCHRPNPLYAPDAGASVRPPDAALDSAASLDSTLMLDAAVAPDQPPVDAAAEVVTAADSPPDVVGVEALPLDVAPEAPRDALPEAPAACAPPVAGRCSDTCVLCRMACSIKPSGCVALIRSQGADTCGLPASPGCAALGVATSDLVTCQVGILRRQLELDKESCTRTLFDRLAREGCQEYIDKRRQRQPALDPSKPIAVAYVRESFTWNGDRDVQYHIDDTTCGLLGVPGSAP